MVYLYPVEGVGWQKMIYKSTWIENHPSQLDCVYVCLNLERSKYNMFVFHQSHCFLGIIEKINGSVSATAQDLILNASSKSAVLLASKFLSFL